MKVKRRRRCLQVQSVHFGQGCVLVFNKYTSRVMATLVTSGDWKLPDSSHCPRQTTDPVGFSRRSHQLPMRRWDKVIGQSHAATYSSDGNGWSYFQFRGPVAQTIGRMQLVIKV